MSSRTTSEIIELLTREDLFSADNDETIKYHEAICLYEELKKNGFLKPRGNQLIDPEEQFKSKIIYNVSCLNGL